MHCDYQALSFGSAACPAIAVSVDLARCKSGKNETFDSPALGREDGGSMALKNMEVFIL